MRKVILKRFIFGLNKVLIMKFSQHNPHLNRIISKKNGFQKFNQNVISSKQSFSKFQIFRFWLCITENFEIL